MPQRVPVWETDKMTADGLVRHMAMLQEERDAIRCDTSDAEAARCSRKARQATRKLPRDQYTGIYPYLRYSTRQWKVAKVRPWLSILCARATPLVWFGAMSYPTPTFARSQVGSLLPLSS